MQLIEKTNERWVEAEVHRLKGEIFFAQEPSNKDPAERTFPSDLDLSRKQHARSSDLSATTSRGHLLRHTNRRDEACAMLAEIYNWFTEGFDTADLKDAKALLEELNR